jgi:hypothetical protein
MEQKNVTPVLAASTSSRCFQKYTAMRIDITPGAAPNSRATYDVFSLYTVIRLWYEFGSEPESMGLALLGGKVVLVMQPGPLARFPASLP